MIKVIYKFFLKIIFSLLNYMEYFCFPKILLKFLLLNFQFLTSLFQHPLSTEIALDTSWYWLEVTASINKPSADWCLGILLWIHNPRLILYRSSLEGASQVMADGRPTTLMVIFTPKCPPAFGWDFDFLPHLPWLPRAAKLPIPLSSRPFFFLKDILLFLAFAFSVHLGKKLSY